VHIARRGTRGEAAALLRGIIANHDDRAHTAHDIAADTDQELLPARVASLLERRTHAVQARRAAYRHWQEQTQDMLAEQQWWIEQHISCSQHQGLDYGLGLEPPWNHRKMWWSPGAGTADDCW
jgi:hypothetical protein